MKIVPHNSVLHKRTIQYIHGPKPFSTLFSLEKSHQSFRKYLIKNLFIFFSLKKVKSNLSKILTVANKSFVLLILSSGKRAVNSLDEGLRFLPW